MVIVREVSVLGAYSYIINLPPILTGVLFMSVLEGNCHSGSRSLTLAVEGNILI